MRFWSLSTGMHCAPALGRKGPVGAGTTAGAAPTAAPSKLGGVSRSETQVRDLILRNRKSVLCRARPALSSYL